MILLTKTSSPSLARNPWENSEMMERKCTKVYGANLSRKQKYCFYSSLLKELHVSESYSDIYKFFYIYLSTYYFLTDGEKHLLTF